MKKLALLCVLSSICGLAMAAKPCEELKTEIAAKIDANKVINYALEIVDADKAEKAGDAKASEAKVVGSCEGGTKKIVYSRK
jgi:Protein of unknown function (DUF1161)